MKLQNMVIEKMQIDDYEEIHQIWSNSDGITLRVIDDSKEGIGRFLKRNPNNSFICRFNEKLLVASSMDTTVEKVSFITL